MAQEMAFSCPLARAGVAVGADGLIIEIHNHPEKQCVMATQCLKPQNFRNLLQEIKQIATVMGRTI